MNKARPYKKAKRAVLLFALVFLVALFTAACGGGDDRFTVLFDSQGGSGVAATTDIESGGKIAAPDTPSKAGFTFAGWYKDAACTVQWVFDTDTVTLDLTLYAKWIQDTPQGDVYTVQFDSQGGNAISAITGIASGGKITLSVTPSRPGYTFNGWYKEASCVNEWVFDTDTVQTNLTLYAKWTQNTHQGDLFTVQFDSQGGDAVATLFDIESGAKIAAPDTPSRPGYTFIGWYKEAACVNEWVFDTDTVQTNLTLYAKWTQDTHQGDVFTVAFDSQGGDAVATLFDIESGAKIAAPDTLSRPSYTFVGWYKEAACVNEWVFDTDTVQANLTLYAKWTQNGPQTISVPYNVNVTEDAIPSGSELIIKVLCGYNLLARRSIPVTGAQTVSGEIQVSALPTDTLTVEVILVDADGEPLSIPIKWQYRDSYSDSETPTPAETITAYISAFSQLYQTGLEYETIGMPFQSDYALSWAAAAVTSMRLAVEYALYYNYDGSYLMASKEAGLPDNFEKIAAYNYACPYPVFFYGFQQEQLAFGDTESPFYEEALFRYSYAIQNPDFVPSLDNSLKTMVDMSFEDLLDARSTLLELEANIFEAYTPPPNEEVVNQDIMRYDPAYWREQGLALLEEENIYGYYEYEDALQYFTMALALDPFDGDNFALCALTHFYLGEYQEMAYYVNHGLVAAPNHEGLTAMYALMKAREEE